MKAGRSAGVTGIIDIPGQAARFEIWARALSAGMNAALLDAAGRGDSEWPELRPGSSNGTVGVGGQLSVAGWPSPDKFRGELGTLTVRMHTGRTVEYPIRVTGCKFSRAEKEQDNWDVTLTCTVVGDPDFDWGDTTQPVAATETFTDKQLWAGSSATRDPDGLQSAGARRILVWGVGDSDSAEKTKLDAVIAAVTPPFTGLKARVGTFTRASKNAAYVDVTFGLTTTAEDVINQNTSVNIDPQGLQSSAKTAALNGTPPTPTGDSFVLRGTSHQELNDGNTLYVSEWGLRSTKSDVEYPGTIARADVDHLADTATATLETASGTPPSAPAAPLGVLVSSESEQLTDGHWRHQWQYANTGTKDRVQFDGSDAQPDVSGLDDGGQATVVNESSTPPATPTAPVSGTKLRRRVSKRIGGTPEKWSHTFHYARRTTEEDITMGESETTADPNVLIGKGRIAVVNSSGTAPSVPTAPSGTKHRGTLSQQIHDGPKWKHVFEYGATDSAEDATFPHTVTETDPNDLGTKATYASLDGSASIPSGTKVRSTNTRQLTSGKTLTTTEAGRRSTVDDVNLPATRSRGEYWEGLKHAVSTVIPDARTPEAIALAYVTANEGDLTYDGVEVTRLDDEYAQVVIHTREDNIVVDFQMQGAGGRKVLYRVDEDGDVVFFVKQVVQVGTSLWEAELASQKYYGSQMVFWITRRVTGDPIPMYWDLVAPPTSNSGEFLGLEAHTVTYTGIDKGRANLSNDTPREVAYRFLYDSLGIFDPGQGVEGWFQTDTDLSSVEDGTWVKATLLGFDDAAPVDGADYGSFLA